MNFTRKFLYYLFGTQWQVILGPGLGVVLPGDFLFWKIIQFKLYI